MSDRPQPSEDPNRTRRKRRSSSNGKNQSNEAPPVLLLLSELCTSHKKVHDTYKTTNTESQLEGRGGKTSIPQHCSDDLNKLRSILLQADLFYQNADVDGATTTDSSNSSHKITSSDISNLCVFYGAVLMGSFCPHSLSLIDYGHDVKEVVYRVFNLIRMFTYDCIVQDSVNHIKRIFGRNNTKSSPSVSDQLAFTAASLIRTIYPQHIIDAVIVDLITLLYDCSILITVSELSPIAGSSKEKKSSSIELQLFGETNYITNPDTTSSSPYWFRIPTYESLLSLQCGILRIIFIVLNVRRTKGTLGAQGNSFVEEIDQFSVTSHSGEERFVCYKTSWLLDLIQYHGDFRATLVMTLKQIIASRVKATLSSSDISLELLSLNNTLTACNLLTLILPDFSKTAEENLWTIGIWSDISELVSFSVYSHMVQIHKMYKDGVDGKISSAIELVNAQISAQLSTLLRDTFIVPIYPYKPEPKNMLRIRNRSVRNLWESLIHFVDIASTPSHADLCKIVLRAIHCSLHVNVSSVRFSNEIDQQDLFALVNDLKIQARAYFISHGLMSQLLSLVRNELGYLSIPILIELSQTINIDFIDKIVSVGHHTGKLIYEGASVVKRPRLSSEVDLETPGEFPDQRWLFILSDPCCQSFMDTALRFAEDILQETSDLDYSQKFEAFQVLDLIAAIEVYESLHLCSSSSYPSSSIQVLHKALLKVISYIRVENMQNSSLFGSPLGRILLQRIVSFGLHFTVAQTYTDGFGDHQSSRKLLLQAMNDLVWKHLMAGTLLNDIKEDEHKSSSGHEHENFNHSVISVLSPRHKEFVTRYVDSYTQSCHSKCSALSVRFGLTASKDFTRCTHRLCLCSLNGDYHTIDRSQSHRKWFIASESYHHSLDKILIEDVVPWYQRCFISVLQVKALTSVDNRLSIDIVMHKWISTNRELIPVYLAILPFIYLQRASCQKLPVNLILADSTGNADGSRDSRFIQYIQAIEQTDLHEFLHSFLLHDDVLVCRSVLDYISTTLDFYTMAITCWLISDKVSESETTRESSLVQNFRHLFDGKEYLLTSLGCDLSLDLSNLQKSINQGQREDSNQVEVNRIINSIIRVVKLITSKLQHFTTPSYRLALWRCLSKCLLLSNRESLQNLLSFSLPAHDNSSQPTLNWLISTCFQDENESIRKYGSYRIGHILLFDNGKKFLGMGLFLSAPPRASYINDILHPSQSRAEFAEQFIAQCDHWANGSMSSVYNQFTTYNSNQFFSYCLHDVMANTCFSYMKTSLLIFSSFCQNVQPDSDFGVLILTESLLRIIRFFLLPIVNTRGKSDNNTLIDMQKVSIHNLISSVAIEELHYLGDHFDLWMKLLEYCDESATPMLFREFMSHAKTEEWQTSHNLYRCLFHFIQSFLTKSIKKLGYGTHQDEVDDDALDFTDRALPSVIAYLVVKQEYDILLACTGFRWSLARYVTAASKNRGRHFTSDYIIGMVFRHQSHGDKLTKTFRREELSRQTSLLCCSDSSNLRIIGRLLSSLLLQPTLSPLRFFLDKVLQSEFSLRDLLVIHEIKIILQVVCELGVLEKEVNPDASGVEIDVQLAWTDSKFDNCALRALIRGATILKNKDGNINECIESLSATERSNESFSLSTVEVTENWVRSHFMMLLVNVDNTKCKGGRALSKLQALKCLRVLLRFLLPEDASKFMTQVLTMIDAAMQLKCSGFDPPFTSSRLRLLGVSSLKHFIHLALSHQTKIVGNSLCQIVVILFPLLNDLRGESTLDPYHYRATKEAVSIIESFLTENRGPVLANYFRFVPFLPCNPLLQKTRSSLSRLGIDLDNLLSVADSHEHRSTHESRGKKVFDVDASSIATSANEASDFLHIRNSKCNALRAYLRVSEYLVRHQHENVRYAALSHLTLVLRRNRGLLHFLIESEDIQTRFLTIIKVNESSDVGCSQDFDKLSNLNSLRGGSISTITLSLLRRCKEETNARNRLALASCLGEIGAIHPSLIGQQGSFKSLDDEKHNSNSYRKNLVPWDTNTVVTDFQLDLITKYFITALKACPTPREQHKIAFAIQEVLKLLNRSVSTGQEARVDDRVEETHTHHPPSMNPWLLDYLTKADVIDVIRPFWTSEYKQQEPSKPRDPPFYYGAETYFSWISSWSRYMIENSYRLGQSPFSSVFFACRSAIRSQAGMGIIMFIFPLLVLDAIVFGDETSKEAMVSEIIGVLGAHEHMDKLKMNHLELLKSIDCVFSLLDTLQAWCNTGVEYQHRSGSQFLPQTTNKAENHVSSNTALSGNHNSWSADVCINAIDDLLDAIPLSLRAKTAASLGMHARALLHLEMEGRWHHSADYDVQRSEREGKGDGLMNGGKKLSISRSHLDNIDLSLMQFILGELNDLDSMSALAQYCDRNGITRTYKDKIQEKEYSCDYDGVIQIYEQAMQIGLDMPRDSTANQDSLNGSYTRALLKMGRLESAHLHVQGILSSESESDRAKLLPSAVEASWRLSRWDHLDRLMQSTNRNTDVRAIFDNNINRYQLFCGKALLGIHKNDHQIVRCSVEESRNAVMAALAVTAQDNYLRVYPYLITLHSLTEIEDAAQLLSADNDSDNDLNSVSNRFADHAVCDSFPGWHWKSRLDLTGRDAEAAIPLLNVRVSLSRLALAKEVEARLWMDLGKIARKCGQHNIAIDALAHAEVLYGSLMEQTKKDSSDGGRSLHIAEKNECRLQLAKIMHASGKSSLALQLLEDVTFQRLLLMSPVDLNKDILKPPLRCDLDTISRNALQMTEWLVDGGFKNASEVIARYRLLLKLVPSREKAHFSFAKYLDSLLGHRVNSRPKGNDLKMDDDMFRMEALKLDDGCQKLLLDVIQEYIMALQLDQKHVFLCLPRMLTLWFDFTSLEGSSALRSNQEKSNSLLRDSYRNIDSISFYTVLPQLISRLNHRDQGTCTIVSAILKRVLTKFPKQAMWSLAWLRNSVHPERQIQGEEIFKGAQKNLQRCNDMKAHDLLVASKALFAWFIQLAKYQPKKPEIRNISLRSWVGEVELSEFLPPVQAALTITRNAFAGPSGNNIEYFPPFVPRMRAFNTQVSVMSSKARPKKLTAFAVPLGIPSYDKTSALGVNSTKAQPGDVGEMHFLIKQEAKGDLRKDARVQDFNNVVNRLLAASSIRSSSGRKKRSFGDLRIRTFSVVCLSEDCGIIEWVPHTNCLRNIIQDEAYNPQAPPISSKRRGKLMADFGDASLRDRFQKCQDLYMKGGNLSGAVKLFDESCIKEFPPLLYWWFVIKFQDPHKWFEAKTRFTLSTAVWSAVGHVIGLGDRHAENMLIDVSSGECVHVDFDCIFDKGLHLPTPEIVPFRLTPNLLDAFGPCGAEGAYSGSLCSVMSTLRENRDLLLSVLEPFVKDPIIDWKRHRGQQIVFGETDSSGANEMKRSVKVIEERLKGIYNLRNPNYKTIRRTDGQASLTDDDDMAYIIPLSIEGQVHKMISEACSHENLVQLYVGWMSWL